MPRSLVPPRYQFGTRDLRLLMARIAVVEGFTKPFPLPLYMLAPADALRAAMLPGTMLHALVRTKVGAPPVSLGAATATVGDEVRAGDPILELHYRDRAKLQQAIGRASQGLDIGDTRPAARPLVVGEVH